MLILVSSITASVDLSFCSAKVSIDKSLTSIQWNNQGQTCPLRPPEFTRQILLQARMSHHLETTEPHNGKMSHRYME